MKGVDSILTDEFEGEVFVGTRFFGVFVQKHHGTANSTMLQCLLTDAGQLRRHEYCMLGTAIHNCTEI